MPTTYFKQEYIDNESIDRKYCKILKKIFSYLSDGYCLFDTALTIWHGKNLVGIAILENKADVFSEVKTNVYISYFGIIKEFRNRGFATLLLKKILDNFSNVALSVRQKNVQALRLYTKHGFISCGDFDYGDGDCGFIMHRLLT